MLTLTDRPESRDDRSPPPHAVAGADLADALAVDPAVGLAEAEVAKRLAAHGHNRLAEPPKRPAWRLFVDQFRNLLVVILMGAAGLAALVGDVKDVVVITVVLLVNAVLGFAQEHRAERSLDALKRMLVSTARVRRGGDVTVVAADELVPGDLVLVEAGDRIPADGRLLAAHAFEVDESSLTGESTPVAKRTAPVAEDAPLAERTGMVFMNTVTTRGRAEVLVTGTGMGSEIGKLAGMLQAAEEVKTPLQRQLDALARRLAIVAAVAVSTFFVMGLARGDSLGDVMLSAVALAVAAIPEGLPAVVTVTLALGTNQLAKRGAIVKRLSSVETLGATSVICSDKTGTLTLNQMTARAIVVEGRRLEVTGEGYRPEGEIKGDRPALLDDALLGMALCNDSRIKGDELVGDPTEGALLTLALKGGTDLDAETARLPRIGEVPFDPAVKLMVTFHEDGDRVRVYAKGAFDALEPRSVIGDEERAELHRDMEELAATGLRVLAVADGELDRASFDPEGDLLEQTRGLRLLGLVGLVDPPRAEARDAIAVCRRAGIAVKMITGDHAATASAIARDLGIPGGVITGAELDHLDDDALAERIEHTGVFARVAPEHKVRLVAALQSQGHVVAMTGDGVNDAPALKTADIGVAMGITGTEVSKEAASMILTDDNFATIVKAVREGRAIYDNIVKFVRFQLATNMGAILSLLGAQLAGLPVPFSAIQVLWVNLIMDGPPAMALGVDPPARDAMDRPPRNPNEPILHVRRLARVVFQGAVMAAGTLGVLAWSRENGTEEHALALAFTTFVLFQLFNVFNARAEHRTVFSSDTLRNGKLWAALAGVLVLQILAVHVNPVQNIFGTADLTLADWAVAVGIASSVLWIEEARKLITNRRKEG